MKDITTYKYDTILDFDDLRKEIRMIEKEHENKKPTPVMAVTTSQDEETYPNLQGIIQRVKTRLKKLENKESRKSDEATGVTYRRTPDRQENRQERYFKQNEYRQMRSNQNQRRYQRNDNCDRDCNYSDIQCYRCGQFGHMAYGCRVRLDHRRSLNFSRPSSSGRRPVFRRDDPERRIQ